MVWVQSLAQELPYAGIAKKEKQRKAKKRKAKKRKEKKKKRKENATLGALTETNQCIKC